MKKKKKEMMVVILYIDFNTNQREPSNTLKVDDLTLFLTLTVTHSASGFYLKKNLESFKKSQLSQNTSIQLEKDTELYITYLYFTSKKLNLPQVKRYKYHNDVRSL